MHPLQLSRIKPKRYDTVEALIADDRHREDIHFLVVNWEKMVAGNFNTLKTSVGANAALLLQLNAGEFRSDINDDVARIKLLSDATPEYLKSLFLMAISRREWPADLTKTKPPRQKTFYYR